MFFRTINRVSKNDVVAYLNKKYGDRGFYFVKEKTCNLLNLGYCTYSFSSKELEGKEFQITWKSATGDEMKDNYIEQLYNGQLTNYYKKYFQNKYDFSFDFEVRYEEECSECNENYISFDEFVELVSPHFVTLYIKPVDNLDYNNKYFHIKTYNTKNLAEKEEQERLLAKSKEEVKKYVISKYDMDKISTITSSIVNLDNLSSIKEVIFYLYDCTADEYWVSCQYQQSIYNKW